VNGKLVSLGTYPTKSGAERALALAHAEEIQGGAPLDADGTVAEWAERWLEDGARRWRGQTVVGYNMIWRKHNMIWRKHVQPRWGDVPLGDVRRADVQRWSNMLGDSGMSTARVRHAVGTLQRILRFAVDHEALPASPIDRLRLATPKPAKVKPLTIKQVEELAKAIESPEYASGGHGAGQPEHRRHRPDLSLWMRLGAYCGLRAGEILALRRESIDLERRVLVIDRSVSDVGGHLVIGPTKTGHTRAVPIPESLLTDLREHLARRVTPEPDALVFTSETGGLVSHAYWYRNYFRPAVKRAGLPEGVRFHDLRHTYASLLIAQGAHPRAIMERSGHSSIQVTLGTYGHLFPTLDEALTGRLDEAIQSERAEMSGAEVAQKSGGKEKDA
jgi:integrase